MKKIMVIEENRNSSSEEMLPGIRLLNMEATGYVTVAYFKEVEKGTWTFNVEFYYSKLPNIFIKHLKYDVTSLTAILWNMHLYAYLSRKIKCPIAKYWWCLSAEISFEYFE